MWEGGRKEEGGGRALEEAERKGGGKGQGDRRTLPGGRLCFLPGTCHCVCGLVPAICHCTPCVCSHALFFLVSSYATQQATMPHSSDPMPALCHMYLYMTMCVSDLLNSMCSLPVCVICMYVYIF